MYRSFERLFRRNPLAVPLSMLVVSAGALFLGLSLAHADFRGLPIGYLVAGGGILAVTGSVMLPFGIVRALRRRMHPVPLTCPKCQTRSQDATPPFAVVRESYLDYVHVTCSSCRADFTLPAEARLV